VGRAAELTTMPIGQFVDWPNGHLLLDIAAHLFQPVAMFGLFSGGHDSLCSTHRASSHPLFTAAAHIDTGIGIPETRRFVRDTCNLNGWDLKYYKAVDQGQRYEDIVKKYGFPGPGRHGTMYIRLKERALRALIREHKTKRSDKIILVSGCRSNESERRMGHVEPIQREGAIVWVNINHNWTSSDNDKYMSEQGLPRNPVKDKLCMSGECLCGAYAKKNELAEIKFHYPEVAERIERIQADEIAKGRWNWEGRPPKGKRSKSKAVAGILCHSCKAHYDMFGDEPESEGGHE